MTNAISDQQIEEPYRKAWEHSPQGAHETYGIPNRYGTGADRNEFHKPVDTSTALTRGGRHQAHILAYNPSKRLDQTKQKGWNRWIPALLGSCEWGELNPHEHTLTAT